MTRLLLLAAVLLLGLTGCATSTAGSGSPAGGAAGFPSPTVSAASSSPGSTPSASAAGSTPAVPPSFEQAQSALQALVPGQLVALVTVGPGFQAISYDLTGDAMFWAFGLGAAGPAWTKVGASSYPWDTTSEGADPPTARGALLTGMSDAVFVLDGAFSGDGSANSVAYTNGPAGWGAIKALPSGDLAGSGQGVTFGGLGLENEFDLVDGQLLTADCSAQLSIAQCSGDNRVIKLWSWNGTEFVLAASRGRSS